MFAGRFRFPYRFARTALPIVSWTSAGALTMMLRLGAWNRIDNVPPPQHRSRRLL